MKNFSVFHHRVIDLSSSSPGNHGPTICDLRDYTLDYSLYQLYLLASDGRIFIYSMIDGVQHLPYSPFVVGNAVTDLSDDDSWFSIKTIPESDQTICISHNGNIVSIQQQDILTSSDRSVNNMKMIEHEGVIDSGICTAKWNADCTTLLIITKENTLISMTSRLDVITEVPIEPIFVTLSVSITWSPDGSLFALLFSKADGQSPANVVPPNKVAIYSAADYTVKNIGRNVTVAPSNLRTTNFQYPTEAVEDSSVLVGLGSVVAFSSNGVYIAVPQKKRKSYYQILLLEKNGLTHGLIDLQLPKDTCFEDSEWNVVALHWDISSTLLAVSLNTIKNGIVYGAVQVYYRSNYHWYLKQEWNGLSILCLGFDTEQEGRLYIRENMKAINYPENLRTVVHIVDILSDVVKSSTSECSTGVIDGSHVRISPLGICTVPPPMYSHSIALPLPCRHICFWASPSSEFQCGIASLLCNGDVVVSFLDKNGRPLRKLLISIIEMMKDTLNINTVAYLPYIRSIAATETIQGGTMSIQLALIGCTCFQDDEKFVSKDFLLLVQMPSPLVVTNESDKTEVLSKDDVVMDIRHVHHSLGRAFYIPSSKSKTSSANPDDSSILLDTKTCLAIPVSKSFDLSQSNSMFVVIIDHVHLSESCNGFAGTIQAREFSRGDKDRLSFESLGQVTGVYHCPEVLMEYIVIAKPLSETLSRPDGNDHLVIGISAKHRLYSGESMLMTGVSSFDVNALYGVVLFVTLGSKPLLYILPINKLQEHSNARNVRALGYQDDGEVGYLDGLMEDNDIENLEELMMSIGCMDPRPVERGSRLVAAVPDGFKVILQHSRGNLESFEPRALILLHVKYILSQSIRESAYFDCLLLLRRQRIDLNVLVDFNISLFKNNFRRLISTIIAKGSYDLLSLFITSLEDENMAALKYPILFSTSHSIPLDEPSKVLKAQDNTNTLWADVTGIHNESGNGQSSNDVTQAGKVNVICRIIREELARYIPSCNAFGIEGSFENQTHAAISTSLLLHPILCTYAKHRPQQLSEALRAIRCVASTSAATDAAIKYLILLANSEQLFNAALGQCDFCMARTVGRLAQMDPKQYNSLIESFESIGRGYASDHVRHSVMNYKIQYYLKDYGKAIDWAMTLVMTSARVENTSLINTVNDNIQDVRLDDIKSILRQISASIVADGNLYDTALRYLPGILHIISTESNAPIEFKVILRDYRNAILQGFGQKSIAQQRYHEAITSLLLMNPPNVSEAIKASLYHSDWTLALSIAQTMQSDERPIKQIAYEIVNQFKQSLQQSEGSSFGSSSIINLFSAHVTFYPNVQKVFADSLPDSPDGSKSTEISPSFDFVNSNVVTDRVREIARICVDYCDDIEEAINILLLSHNWLYAIQLAMIKGRRDLFIADIKSAVLSHARSVLKAIDDRKQKHIELVQELSVIWKDGDERIKQVSSSDAKLFSHMNQKNKQSYDKTDNVSEYSGVSIISHASNISGVSRSSRSSRTSGMSSVSMLSDLSQSTSSSLSSSKTKESSFSIEGLDHTLLSRGKISNGSEDTSSQNLKRYGKKEKREEKKRIKGEGKDVWGLKREGRSSSELWLLGDIKSVSESVNSLIEALLVAFPSTDIFNTKNYDSYKQEYEEFQKGVILAKRLQDAMDDYVQIVILNPPPIAPNYPIQWLCTRGMGDIYWFQDRLKSNADKSNDRVDDSDDPSTRVYSSISNLNWWRVAADGVKLWRQSKRRTL